MRFLGLCFFVSFLLFSKGESSGFYSVKIKSGLSSDQQPAELEHLRAELKKLGFTVTMTIGNSVLIEVVDAADINKLAGATFHGGYAPTNRGERGAVPYGETKVATSEDTRLKVRVFPNEGSKDEAKQKLEREGIKVFEESIYSLLVEATEADLKKLTSWGWSIRSVDTLPMWMQADQQLRAKRCRAAVAAQ